MKDFNLKVSFGTLALAIIIMGAFIYKGLKSFSDKERVVTVRGLSERIVDADNANLTIKYEVAANDMSEVLSKIEQNNTKIKEFVKSKGLTEEEITINVPSIEDRKTDRYAGQNTAFRYYATVKIVLISDKVKNIRGIEMDQFDLFKQGINLVSQSEYYYDGNSDRTYHFTKLNDIKPDMIKESIQNAKKAADEFAQNSNAKVKNIKSAYQGQFDITPTDDPLKVKVRVVSTIEYFIR